MILLEWREFPSAPCLAGKETWWQFASRFCWHASELISTPVRIYIYIYILISASRVSENSYTDFPYTDGLLCIYTHKKGKVIPLQVRCDPEGGGRGIALLFLDRGTRRGWVVSSTPRPHFTPGKHPVPILEEARWAPGPVWTGGKSRPHRDSIPVATQPVVSRYTDWATRPTKYIYIYIYIYIHTHTYIYI